MVRGALRGRNGLRSAAAGCAGRGGAAAGVGGVSIRDCRGSDPRNRAGERRCHRATRSSRRRLHPRGLPVPPAGDAAHAVRDRRGTPLDGAHRVPGDGSGSGSRWNGARTRAGGAGVREGTTVRRRVLEPGLRPSRGRLYELQAAPEEQEALPGARQGGPPPPRRPLQHRLDDDHRRARPQEGVFHRVQPGDARSRRKPRLLRGFREPRSGPDTTHPPFPRGPDPGGGKRRNDSGGSVRRRQPRRPDPGPGGFREPLADTPGCAPT